MVVLAGGTGGAKLARGMLDVVGGDTLVVIANTGDDIEIYGAYVTPDPDLVTFWLADRIDERGWGLAGDTFRVMEGLKRLSVDVWFNLGDEDLAIGIERARRLDQGERLTEAHAAIVQAIGAPGRILPMCDAPVRTRVMAAGRWWPFQEYMIRSGGAGSGRGRRFPRRPQRPPDPRDPRRDRDRQSDRHRPVEPGHLDRSDPRDPRDARRAQRQPGPSGRGQSARRRRRSSRAPPRHS